MPRKRTHQNKKNSRALRGTPTLIYCQGTKTEPAYFNKLKSIHRIAGLNIRSEAKSPLQLVKIAKRVAKEQQRERLFIVVDMDQTRRAEVEQAIAECKKRSGIDTHLIISNPAFEGWLYLHDRAIRPPTKPLPEIVSYLQELGYLDQRDSKKIMVENFPFGEWKTAAERNPSVTKSNEWVEPGNSAIATILEYILIQN